MRLATAVVALHLAVALFGFAALFGQWIALPPAIIVLGRTLVAAMTLALAAPLFRRATGRPSMALAVNGALLALHWVSFFAAVQTASVAIGLLSYASFPAFVVAIESVVQRRRPRLGGLAVVGVVALGLALLVPDFSWSSRAVHGLAWGLVSGFTFALLAVRNRAWVSRIGPITLALWQNGFAALWLLALVASTFDNFVITGRELVLIVVLGVVCTALAHTLFIASLLRVPAATASVVSVLEPVYGIALAALLQGEIPDARTLAGGALIVLAALLATRRVASRP
jgi:drug/metabolite transporter (DMT)-like permease